MKIGFLGCGLIAEPMVRALWRLHPGAQIRVSQRSAETSARLCRESERTHAGDNQWVLDGSDVIVLSLLADTAREVLPQLSLRADQRVISVMADISLDEVSAFIAPATDPCVTIPLPFIDTGGCPLPVYPASSLLEELYGAENTLIPVASESAMGPHFAATALLSTLMAQLHETAKWLGGKTGDPAAAETYVASLVSGYLNVLEKDGQQRFIEAMKDLSTEGGLNTQLLNHNRDAGMLQVLKTGLEQLGERLKARSEG